VRRTSAKIVKGEKYDEAKIVIMKGDSLFKNGELEEALFYFKKARKLDPDNDEYIEKYNECKSAIEERNEDQVNDDDDEYNEFTITLEDTITDGDDQTIIFNLSFEDAMSGEETFRIRFRRSIRCIKCNGSGKIGIERCEYCMGQGKNLISERVVFKVPPGVQDMTKLCFRGMGGPGLHGGRDGNLYILLRVAKPKKKLNIFGF
jgi:tetratricopeptide (TPR) repeat protein